MKKLIVFTAVFGFLSFAGCSSVKQAEKPAGGIYVEDVMKSLVNPPKDIPCYLQPMIKIADDKAKKEMLTGRLLAWTPKIAVSSGLLELYVEEGAAACLDERMMALIRIAVSYTVPSRFALDINAWNYKDFGISQEELKALMGREKIDNIASFSDKEKAALKYAVALSKTPIELEQGLLNDLRRLFSEKQIVAAAALTAKVNYWTRLIEGLRVKPAGYTDDPILKIEEYKTLKK